MAKVSKSTMNSDDIEAIKSDVASFASSLGLSSAVPSSGFNDADFRKTGPIKPSKPKQKKKTDDEKEKPQSHKDSDKRQNEKPKPKPPVLTLDDSDKSKGFDKFKNLPKLPLIKASLSGMWYEEAAELEVKVIGEGKGRLDVSNVEEWKAVVEKKKELAERLMAQYARDYMSSKGRNPDIKMSMKTQRTGTAADKVSAFSIMVGDNPIANLRSLDALIGMVTSKVGKRHAFTGFEALKELFIFSLLPDRKLKTLLQRPLNQLPENKDGYSLLLLWYWEDCLKQRYERFVFALEEASRDMLAVLKDKALKTIYTLLMNKSEQERRLLSALVNKLGDPQHKGASNANFHLSNLLSEHPSMKVVVIDEVDSFLFRPHLGLRSKYHAVNFLSHIRLSSKGDGPKVAKRLIDVYFALFKLLITEASGSPKEDKKRKTKDGKGVSLKDGNVEGSLDSHTELDSRLLSALLTGVNRAFPFVSSDEADDIIEVQTPMLFQLVHSKNFNIGVQALMLLDKIASKNQIVSDRFYRSLYSKLLLPAVMNSSKAEMFIGLILRAMKADVNLKRVSAFAKRLLQVALQQPPQYACGCLFLLSEVLKARPPLWNMVVQSESVDDDLEHFKDIVEETDNDSSSQPKKQESLDDFIPSGDDDELRNDSSEDEEIAIHSEDDSDEAEDEPEDEGDDEAEVESEDEGDDEAEDLLVRDGSEDLLESKQKTDHSGPRPQMPSTRPSPPGGYNPRHREPSYCNADRVSWWELMVLASHVHPSVSTMAKTLLSGANIVYNGNPLNDLSLTAFLDKFMEKKPKQSSWHGGSQIEPAKKLEMNHQLIGPEILSLAEDDVAPEDFVFHKFYMNKMNSSKKPKKKKKKNGVEDEAAEEILGEDGGGESDDEEIDNMLDSADFALEDDGNYDYDDLDRVANEDDDDLVGNASDAELDAPSDIGDGELDGTVGDDMSEDEDDVNIGDVDDDSDEEDVFERPKGKRKSIKTGASPFASLEDYEHLLNEEDTPSVEPKQKKRRRGKKSEHLVNEDGTPSKESKPKKRRGKKRPRYPKKKKLSE